jgi:nicotinamidase-related amidase
VDFQVNYLGRDVPTADQLDEYPTAGGRPAWKAFRRARSLLSACRRASIPVILTRIAYSVNSAHTNVFAAKRGSAELFIEGTPGVNLAEGLQPRNNERVITKRAASAFFDTDLHDYLTSLEIDTLLVGGLTTSGCVRATVVDAVARGYRVAVVVDATADRLQLSHRASLLDMWMKYADLLTAKEAIAWIRSMDW